MPPIGERLTDIKAAPLMSSEQREQIRTLELEIGKRMGTLAPPVGGYMVYPLFWSPDLTLTMSGCATYQAGNRNVSAVVTRDCNNAIKLRTFVYDDIAEGETVEDRLSRPFEKGVTVGVSKRTYDEGELEYTLPDWRERKPTTYEQFMNALSNISETLDLVEAANLETYGVSNFAGLDQETLVAIREQAEPGLVDFVEQSMKEYSAHA